MYRRLFRNRNFLALWIGQMISFVGDYFVMLAVPIAINRLTGSAMMVGLSFIAAAIPALLLGPVAGVFIDRWDRRKVMIISDGMRALLVLLMLLVRSADQVWIFYLANFLVACTSQFFMPARNAVLPLVVADRDDLLAANGLMQLVGTVGFLAGPALAGFAIAAWGEAPAFLANSLGYLASALAVMTMVVPRTTRSQFPPTGALGVVLAELRSGLAFLFGNRSTLGVMVMLAVAQLGIGAFIVVWVPFLQRYFNQGAQGVGLVDSSFGAGMLLGGLLLGWFARRVRMTPLAAVGMLVMGFISLPIGYLPTFFLVIVVNVLFGIAWVPVQSALTTIMQLAVPDLMRGKVSSSLNAVVTVGGLLSMGLASFAGEAIGLRNIFVVVGAMIIISGLLGFALLREPAAEAPAAD
ncbi:MAG TPA: MFS transporter, partial [Anaerolinea sp.]|nr:MFS transporter [Anaerolinea sp.]